MDRSDNRRAKESEVRKAGKSYAREIGAPTELMLIEGDEKDSPEKT
jgi:hypothetical protein